MTDKGQLSSLVDFWAERLGYDDTKRLRDVLAWMTGQECGAMLRLFELMQRRERGAA